MNESKFRFEGALAEEFEHIVRIMPHHHCFQEATALAAIPDGQTGDGGTPKCLEIGCGTGFTTLEILKSHPDAHVVALDNDPQMLIAARKNLAEFVESGKLKVIEQDALTYLKDCPAQEFNSVISAATLHNILPDERGKIVNQIYRILKPGGVFVNGDKYVQDEPMHSQFFEDRLNRFSNVFGSMGRPDLAERWIEHYKEDDLPERRLSDVEMRSLLVSSGFIDLQDTYREHMEAVILGVKPSDAV